MKWPFKMGLEILGILQLKQSRMDTLNRFIKVLSKKV